MVKQQQQTTKGIGHGHEVTRVSLLRRDQWSKESHFIVGTGLPKIAEYKENKPRKNIIFIAHANYIENPIGEMETNMYKLEHNLSIILVQDENPVGSDYIPTQYPFRAKSDWRCWRH